MKLTAEERAAEIARVEGMCSMVLDFAAGSGQRSPLGAMLVEQAVAAGDLVSLRWCFKEFVKAIASGLTPEDYSELDRRLKAAYGSGLSNWRKTNRVTKV